MRGPTPRQTLRTILIAGCAFAALTAPAHADPPAATAPGLEGEYLSAGHHLGTSVSTADRTCDPNGQSGITFSASGVAAGPYPGRFTEQGWIVIGPQTTPSGPTTVDGPVREFHSRFEIASATGDVVGVKRYSSARPDAVFGSSATYGTCRPANALVGRDFFQVAVTGVEYDAVIRTALGTFRDRGLAFASLENQDDDPSPPSQPDLRSFDETFLSDAAVAVPFKRKDCKQGDTVFLSKKACKDFFKGAHNHDGEGSDDDG